MLRVKTITVNNYTNLDDKNMCLIEQDVYNAMKDLNLLGKPLIYIKSFEGSQKEKLKQLKDFINIFKSTDCIIITQIFILSNNFFKEDNELLKSLNFINISQYIEYENSIPYIYGNKYGIVINTYFKSL